LEIDWARAIGDAIGDAVVDGVGKVRENRARKIFPPDSEEGQIAEDRAPQYFKFNDLQLAYRGSSLFQGENAKITLTATNLRIDEGPMTHAVIPLAEIREIDVRRIPIFRSAVRGGTAWFSANILSYAAVMTLTQPVKVMVGMTRRVTSVAVDVEDLEGFVKALVEVTGVVPGAEAVKAIANVYRQCEGEENFRRSIVDEGALPAAILWALYLVTQAFVPMSSDTRSTALWVFGGTIPPIIIAVLYGRARVRRTPELAVPAKLKISISIVSIFAALLMLCSIQYPGQIPLIVLLLAPVPTLLYSVRMYFRAVIHTARGAWFYAKRLGFSGRRSAPPS
jgi:hypothetical protein